MPGRMRFHCRAWRYGIEHRDRSCTGCRISGCRSCTSRASMRLKLAWIARASLPAILLLVAQGTFYCPGFAQSEAQPGWTLTTTTQIRPEMRQEFEACLTKMVA